MLADDQLIEILNGGESECVEFTEFVNDLDKIREAVCAFANDLPDNRQPGLIFIGIKDDGNCAGTTIDDSLLRTLGGLRNDGKILPFPVMEVGKRTLRDCTVAVIEVQPSDNPPIRIGGRCWIRTGPRRGLATAEEERRLTEKRTWGNLPFDMQPLRGASVEGDLDMQRFESEYLPCAISPEALRENSRDLRDQLQALRLARDGAPTATAILILGKEPRSYFPGAYIQFVRHDGNNLTDPIKNQTELSGTLPDQLRGLDELLKNNISTALDTRGERHIEKPDYPLAALRELSRNAVIHRNYDCSNTPVRIHWFSDSIEIISLGSVYGEVTRENFGQPGATAYRNPTIAEAMKNLGFMERFGRGIGTAREKLDANGNPPLDFKIEDTLVFVKIHKAGNVQ